MQRLYYLIIIKKNVYLVTQFPIVLRPTAGMNNKLINPNSVFQTKLIIHVKHFI